MKKLLLAALAASYVAAAGFAQAAGDAEAGKNNSASCAACHGADGNSVIPTNPKLAGQHTEYLVAAMKAYKDGGTRNDPLKKGLMMPLSDQDIENLAAYYSSLPPK
ncbi:MAG: cytochrome c [Gammaproteobacteria bacterium]|nr:cytochrome c [Gammaproteobacteria bacterium]